MSHTNVTKTTSSSTTTTSSTLAKGLIPNPNPKSVAASTNMNQPGVSAGIPGGFPTAFPGGQIPFPNMVPQFPNQSLMIDTLLKQNDQFKNLIMQQSQAHSDAMDKMQQQHQQQSQQQKQQLKDSQQLQMQQLQQLTALQAKQAADNQGRQLYVPFKDGKKKGKEVKQVKRKRENDDTDDTDDDSDDDNNKDESEFRKLSDLDRNAEICDHDLSEEEFRHIFPFLSAANPDGSLIAEYAIFSVLEVAKENNKEKKTLQSKNVPMDKKLTGNMVLVTKKQRVKKGWDNKKTKLHPLRYDRFPLTRSQQLYVMAAKYFAENKIVLDPVRDYDLSHLNIPNTVSDRGWVECHNPSSQSIQLKFYTRENFERERGSSNWTVITTDDGGQCVQRTVAWCDIESMDKFNHAFFILKVVRTRTLPWDHSLEVVELYLIDHSFFVKPQMANGFHRFITQGAFCAGYVEYCMRANAAAFDAQTEHLGSRDMDSTLAGYCRYLGYAKCRFVGAASYQNEQGGQGGQGKKGQAGPASKKAKTEQKKWSVDDWKLASAGSQYIGIWSICKNYNLSECKLAVDEETHRCSNPEKNGEQKLHVCNKRMPSKFPCGQLHPSKDHNK